MAAQRDVEAPPLGLDCRFYRKKLPEVDSLVRVRILDREEHGFRCVLLEYNNIEGLVLLNELKRGRVRSYHKILKKNKEYTVLVLRVHEPEVEEEITGCFIDLSLKAVPRDQLPGSRDVWEKSKRVHGIMRHVAAAVNGKQNKCPTFWTEMEEEKKEAITGAIGEDLSEFNLEIMNTLVSEHNLDKKEADHLLQWYTGGRLSKKKTEVTPEELYGSFGWPLADKYKYIYSGFKQIMNEEDPIAAMINHNVPQNCIPTLLSELSKRMQPTPETVRARITMKCFSKAAVEGIQAALAVGLEQDDEELPIVIRVVAAPNFEICCTTMEPELGMKKVTEVMELMRETLLANKGQFEVTEQPVIERIADEIAGEMGSEDEEEAEN